MSRADETRASAVALAIILCPLIAAVAVALRIYTRVFLIGARFLEDYCIVFAMVSSVAMSVFMGISVLNGFGRHIETVSSEELIQQGKYARISVILFEKYLCYGLIVVLVVQSLTLCGIHLGLCTPFHALWTPNVPGATCLNRTTVYYVQLSLTIATDFIVLVVPLFILRHLSLP
ncbi:hypothetical protein C8A00DRAFT_36920 [Chaetomidium leptoderma]|uniref:Rhodopsin domain-containing protein n=1 Tax=Chaetomidium leptoderma TaxID=669021 RepID=A0AAN6VFE4_9PEZI|nr:hypothetical protein C8A00DRAFT_36920 [Chaetomidium leptoderma]